MTECTTEDCANPTDLYLCNRCVEDLQKWLDEIPSLVHDLAVTVARLDKVNPAGGGGGGKPGSKAPINLGAFEVRWYLSAITLDAKDHAKDPEAATTAENIIRAVNLAEHLVLGPKAETPNLEGVRERLEEKIDPMPTRELIQYLRDKAHIAITSMDIRNWARRGKIRPVTRDPQPTYNAMEVIDAWHETRRETATANA